MHAENCYFSLLVKYLEPEGLYGFSLCTILWIIDQHFFLLLLFLLIISFVLEMSPCYVFHFFFYCIFPQNKSYFHLSSLAAHWVGLLKDALLNIKHSHKGSVLPTHIPIATHHRRHITHRHTCKERASQQTDHGLPVPVLFYLLGAPLLSV